MLTMGTYFRSAILTRFLQQSLHWFKLSAASLLIFMTPPTLADSFTVLHGMEDNQPQKGHKLIPYAFYNDVLDAAAAVVYVGQGYIQPQVNIVANAFYSSNGSYNGFLMIKDLQVPVFDRLFLDAWGFSGEWGSLESYRDGNQNFPNERAGSHGSHEDNFTESEGSDEQVRLDFRYLLPIGHGEKASIHKYVVDKNGLLISGSESGGESWNPFSSGRTFVEFSVFDRGQHIEDQFKNSVKLKTTAFRFGLSHDNTDFWSNPSYGSRQRITMTRDWGGNDEDGASWTTIEAEYSKFFDLGASDTAYQRVLAFNAWMIDTPTWDSTTTINGATRYHRPPVYQGATLGGLDRQRAYPTARFNDRSAVNYALEYRHKNKWNPFSKIPLINKLRIPWWQWVGFVELGRVNDEWNLDELHSDMNWSAGAGVRINVEGLIVRLDAATSNEQGNIQMFIGQTF